ncbi:MAG: phage holin family protein [Halobacteriota archaeon]
MENKTKPYLRNVARTLVIWVSEAVGLLVLVHIIPGLSINSFAAAIVFVVVLGIVNAILWPILTRFTLRFLTYTFGIGALLLNALMVWLTSILVPGAGVEGLGALILTPIGLAAINVVVSSLLTDNDDAWYYRNILSGEVKKAETIQTEKVGTIFLEIDGLAESVLKKAIANGYLPTLARWLERGSHKITSWETDLSSQTGASQAGILHGHNHDLPAFRWVEKEHDNKIMVSTGFSDAPQIEARISDGHGLLAKNGASRSNLFSGDASDNILTYSRLKDRMHFYSKSWLFFYSNPSNFPRIIALFLWDIIDEFVGRVRQLVFNVKPRLRKGLFIYFLTRAAANVFLREITTDTLVGDLIAGRADVVYATYVAYDEIAHHNGITDIASLRALKQLDKQFHRLELATSYAQRPYQLVVLSDHGQVNGATFKQRCGFTLESLVRKLIGEGVEVFSALDSNQDHFGQGVADPIVERKDYAVRKVRPVADAIARKRREHVTPPEEARVIVLASGNLGLIYLTDWRERASYEQINRAFPRLIPGLVSQEWIGFVMVRSRVDGPMVIGKKGTHFLPDDRCEGESPLASFEPRSTDHLRRTDGFRYVPDILVNSVYDPDSDEAAAFEELIGSHGGLGGTQCQPFVMYPAEWDLTQTEIVGAEQLHEVLKCKLQPYR